MCRCAAGGRGGDLARMALAALPPAYVPSGGSSGRPLVLRFHCNAGAGMLARGPAPPSGQSIHVSTCAGRQDGGSCCQRRCRRPCPAPAPQLHPCCHPPPCSFQTIVAGLSSMPNGIAWNGGSLFIASLDSYKSCTVGRGGRRHAGPWAMLGAPARCHQGPLHAPPPLCTQPDPLAICRRAPGGVASTAGTPRHFSSCCLAPSHDTHPPPHPPTHPPTHPSPRPCSDLSAGQRRQLRAGQAHRQQGRPGGRAGQPPHRLLARCAARRALRALPPSPAACRPPEPQLPDHPC